MSETKYLNRMKVLITPKLYSARSNNLPSRGCDHLTAVPLLPYILGGEKNGIFVETFANKSLNLIKHSRYFVTPISREISKALNFLD